MTNEEFVRQAYAIAEVKDLAGVGGVFQPPTECSWTSRLE